jgi:hypothetical protein
MRTVRLLAVPLLLLSLAATAGSAAAGAAGVRQTAGQRHCSLPVPLSIPPAWISSAVFVPSLQRILVVDSALNRLLLFTESGQGTVITNPEVSQAAKLPALIAATENGFVLKLVGRDVVTFGPDLRLAAQKKSLVAAAPGGQGTLGSIYQWTVAGPSIVAYGSIRSASFPDGYQLGFLRTPLPDHPGVTEMLMPFEDGSYYVYGNQYLSSVGSTAYFLRLDKTATLFKAPAGARAPVPLANAVPEPFRTVPTLKVKMTGPADAPAAYEELESLKIPVGLCTGPDGFLYLLTRQPAKLAGRTDWWLHRIDPEDGRVTGKAHLPTSAKHLTVVPGPDRFFLFERGDVSPIGSQVIKSLISVDAAAVVEHATPEGTEVCP